MFCVSNPLKRLVSLLQIRQQLSFNRISISIKVLQFSVNKTIVFDISIDVPTNLTEAMYHSEISYNLPIFYIAIPKKYNGENR